MISTDPAPSTPVKLSGNYTMPLTIISSLFFIFGFITSMNDVLIPKFKGVFQLSYFQSTLIQFCFFLAYFIVSGIYYFLSLKKGDPILKMGYKNALIIGLLISSVGSFLFYPAANTSSYSLFLLALFILASGITMLQISANPYVTLLGKPETASGRLNLVQAFNSVGTTIAPLAGGLLILKTVSDEMSSSGIETVKAPYLIITLILLSLALIVKISRLPEIKYKEEVRENTGSNIFFKYRQLAYGMIGIFMYVGGEVGVGSFVVNFLGSEDIAGFPEDKAAHYLSFFWGGAMIGRFFGAVFLSGISGKKKMLYSSLIFIAVYFYLSQMVKSFDIVGIEYYWGLIFINLLAFIVGSKAPQRTLYIFSFMIIIALLVGIFGRSHWAMWSILGVGLFNSVMFPIIFSLGVRDIQKDTSQGSSLMIMAVVGGAILPPLQGMLADYAGIRLSFLVPIICYAYLVFYGLHGYKKYQEIQN